MLDGLQSTLILPFLTGLNNYFEKKGCKESNRVPIITP